MLAVLFGIKCKKKVLAKQNNAKKSASTIGKRLHHGAYDKNQQVFFTKNRRFSPREIARKCQISKPSVA